MKKLLGTLLLVVTASAFAQESDSLRFQYLNNFQIEAGGHCVVYSINYERFFLNSNSYKTSVQIGISYYPPKSGIRDFWIPVSVNGLKSYGKHHVEAGIGMVAVREAIRDAEYEAQEWFWSAFISGRIGYRYQKPNGRLTLRIGFTPLLELDAIEFHPLAGLAVGYTF